MVSIKESMELFSFSQYNKNIQQLNGYQLHDVVAKSVMAQISPVWQKSKEKHLNTKRACYFSAEFLVGRAIYNNLISSGYNDIVESALKDYSTDLSKMEVVEDSLLGNGGLGRLAACFLDSGATLNLPLDGYGIRYRFGLFKQKIENGFQKEYVSDWLENGDPWSVKVPQDAKEIVFANQTVIAMPYDMPIIGYGGKHISTLRLWQSEPKTQFDFNKFNEQQYNIALENKNSCEDISRVLYPNDTTRQGKLLRLKQQYFFTSASLQDIIKKYKSNHKNDVDYRQFADYITIQLNDTHPVISILEFIRLLQNDNVSFANALTIAKNVFNYTNHTIMQEALEKWDLDLIEEILPQLADIVKLIHKMFMCELEDKHFNQNELSQLMIIQDKQVHMAHLACYVAKYINGVAQLHTQILENDVLKYFYLLYPYKFQNKTNGITQRRWLLLSNKDLSDLITDLLGNSNWITDLTQLKKLEKYKDDEDILNKFMAIKLKNKKTLSYYMLKRDYVDFNVQSIVDSQIKRLHEYKRQLLNILVILELYYEIKEGTITDFYPTTFIFGGKAAPGYYRAKAVIKLINTVADLINNDSKVNQYIKVIFVSDYDVSYAEKIISATDVSEQISTAGTEASGTGNMKFMLNGSVTLGTYDGANVEIVKYAGQENNYIFGGRVEDFEKVKDSYSPIAYYNSNDKIKRVLDALTNSSLSDGGTGMFEELRNSILEGASWHRADQYYLLYDFDECLDAKIKVNKDYKDRFKFAKKCWLNMCNAGEFSSDRTISQYADDIWHIEEV